MEKTTTRSLLLDKGIILQSGTICRDKINLISGAMTTPLLETIWTFSGYDTEAMERISAIFTHLYHEGREAEMMAILRILYDLSGLKFPEDVELLTTPPGSTTILPALFFAGHGRLYIGFHL